MSPTENKRLCPPHPPHLGIFIHLLAPLGWLNQVLNAVSWAKFGERSTLDFKWNCIKEKIAAVEGIEPRDVSTLLRNEADIVLLEKK